jgi:predicted enzyme related to lactoylglutathione lyase
MLVLADVAVVVSDAKASARWWEEKVGFVSDRVHGSDHAIVIAPPGDRFVLHLCEGFAPLEPGDSGIAFVTDAIEPLVARMLEGGVSFPEPLKKEPWGSMAKFADPDGNIFWLLEVTTKMVRETLRSRAHRPVSAGRTPARKVRAARRSRATRPGGRKRAGVARPRRR